jgi:hypothetical protein
MSGPDIGTITSLRQPPPAAPAKDGFERFIVNAACGADLVCFYRVSLLPSTLWPWYRSVAVTPSQPCPAHAVGVLDGVDLSIVGFNHLDGSPIVRLGNTRPSLHAIGAWHSYAGSNTSSATRPAPLHVNSYCQRGAKAVLAERIPYWVAWAQQGQRGIITSGDYE